MMPNLLFLYNIWLKNDMLICNSEHLYHCMNVFLYYSLDYKGIFCMAIYLDTIVSYINGNIPVGHIPIWNVDIFLDTFIIIDILPLIYHQSKTKIKKTYKKINLLHRQ